MIEAAQKIEERELQKLKKNKEEKADGEKVERGEKEKGARKHSRSRSVPKYRSMECSNGFKHCQCDIKGIGSQPCDVQCIGARPWEDLKPFSFPNA